MGLAAIFIVGCDDKGHFEPLFNNGPVGSVTMVLGTDTLDFLPGDSASTTITILVSDPDGNISQGQRVQLTLDHPELGFISYLDPVLQDTTNAQGRVDFLFTAIGIEGDMIFTANTDDAIAWKLLAIREVFIGTMQITMTPHPLSAALGDTVTVRVCMAIADMQGNTIEGIRFRVGECGESLIYSPPTDTSGGSCVDWNIEVLQEEYCLAIGLGELIREFPIIIDIIDTNRVSNGETPRK